jgi:hypothetical protein
MARDNIEKHPATPNTLCACASEEKFGKEKELEDNVDGRSIHSSLSAHSEQSTVADNHDVENTADILARTYTPKMPIVNVPRSERRGLFARFSLMAEVTNPYDYKNSTKWFITFIVAIAAAAAPVGSAIILRKYTPAARSLDCVVDSLVQQLSRMWPGAFTLTQPRLTWLLHCIC